MKTELSGSDAIRGVEQKIYEAYINMVSGFFANTTKECAEPESSDKRKPPTARRSSLYNVELILRIYRAPEGHSFM